MFENTEIGAFRCAIFSYNVPVLNRNIEALSIHAIFYISLCSHQVPLALLRRTEMIDLRIASDFATLAALPL